MKNKQTAIFISNVTLASDLKETNSSAQNVNIRIVDTQIVAVGAEVTASAKDEIIDGTGLIAMTGLVDLHTHLREPGFEQSETVLSGSQAAAAGGFTTVFAMANTMPVSDTAGVVEQIQALGDRAGYVTVRPIGAVTQGLEGERLSEIGAMANSPAQVRVFSDDGMCVHDALLMRRALEYVKTFNGVIAQHAQDPRLTEGAQMNEGALSSELGLKGWPAVAEESIIARDVLLAEHTGSRLHICHLSTAGSVEVIRWAKKRGINVTAEVTPHHLLLTEDKAKTYDATFKVNPPLRREEDVHALRRAVSEGLIDIIATDHAPHPIEKKECAWDEAAFGMVGLESALSIAILTLVNTNLVSWARLEELLSHTPAKIGSYEHAPTAIAEGEIADLVLVDPAAERIFDESKLKGKSSNSPFLGLRLPGSVHTTIRHGYVTYQNGTVTPADEISKKATRLK